MQNGKSTSGRHRVPRPIGRWLWTLLLAVPLLAVGPPVRAQGVVATEYAVKAAFLYQFPKFIEWPASVGGPAPDPVILCVVGADPFGPALDELSARGVGGLAEGAQVRVRHVAALERRTGCHIAFISNSERGRLKEHLAAAVAGHVVTVSDLRGFAEDGGVIQFVMEDGRVRFRINRGTAIRSGVHLSSRLLALAQIVDAAPAGTR